MKYHLTHIIPGPALHIFHGYKEIIETIQWGLAEHGHEVTYAINVLMPDAVNIVFGAQMLEVPILEGLPRNTVVYFLEPIAGLRPEQIRDSVRYCAENFSIWDYSEFNLATWKALNPQGTFRHVPIGYAPILTRIEKSEPQDIDVLFYGGPGGMRLQVFADLCQSLVKAVFVHGLYGASRDGLIARSKLVLNINQYPDTHVFEIARVSYLLANRKAVISDFSASSKIEATIAGALKFVPVDSMVGECLKLLADDAARTALEEAGFEIIRRRDIREILRPVLDGA